MSKTNFFFLSICTFSKVRESNVPSVFAFLAPQWPKTAFLGTDPPFLAVKKMSKLKNPYHTISSYIKWTYDYALGFFSFVPLVAKNGVFGQNDILGLGGSKMSKTNFFSMSIHWILKVRESNVPSVFSFLAPQWPKMAFLGTDPPFLAVKKMSKFKNPYHTISLYTKWTYESIGIFFGFCPWWPKMAFLVKNDILGLGGQKCQKPIFFSCPSLYF